MKIIEGKSPAERNKIIAALVLGGLALVAIGYNVLNLFPGKKTSVASKPTPTPSVSPSAEKVADLPTAETANFEYESTEITYTPGSFSAPDALRNIFAFGEAPQPTPVVMPTPVVTLPSPTPTPPMLIASVMPQSVYAGAKAFRLEVNGEKFTPQVRIYFNGSEMPTTFVNDRKVWADVPANFVIGEGVRMIKLRTPDGKFYSNDTSLNVMAPPRPNFTYLGQLVRRRSNNDMAYIQEQGSQNAVGRRLNDIIGGRFRLVSISAARIIVEDINLGFRHTVNISTSAMGPSSSPQPSGFSPETNFVPYNPNAPQTQPIPVPRYQQRPNQPPNPNQGDEEDDGDGDGGSASACN